MAWAYLRRMDIHSLTNVLGATLPIVRRYEDGSFDCPFCHNAVIVPITECQNPWCAANPLMPVAAAQKAADKAAEQQREDDRRKRDTAFAILRIEEGRASAAQFRADTYAEAKRRGTCVACCLDKYDRVRFVKHRGMCPKAR